MAAMSFWEAYVEGRNPWDKRKLGWCLKLGKFKLPAYHFYVFIVMIPMLLSLPLVIYGWNLKLFGIIFSAYMVGILLEDFLWFIVNPAVNFKKDFNPDFASYYPWIKIGKFQIPAGYPVSVFLSLLSWYFLWR
jgi:hypothetical protein